MKEIDIFRVLHSRIHHNDEFPLLGEIRSRNKKVLDQEVIRREDNQHLLAEEERKKRVERQTYVDPVSADIQENYWETVAPPRFRQLVNEVKGSIECNEGVELEESVRMNFSIEDDEIIERAKKGELGIGDVESVKIRLFGEKTQAGERRDYVVFGEPGIRSVQEKDEKTIFHVFITHNLLSNLLELQFGKQEKSSWYNDEEGLRSMEVGLVKALDDKDYKYIYQEPQTVRL